MQVLRGVTRAAIKRLFLLAALACSACTAPRPWLAPLAPDTLGASVQARQEVIATRGGEQHSLQVALKVDAASLTMIGLSPLGQRLFTLTWDGQDARLVTHIENLEGIDPEWILADLQMTYWPLAPLRTALPQDLHLTEHGSARALWRGEHLLWYRSGALADIWRSNVELYNGRLGYRLTIRPLGITGGAQ